MNKLLVILKGKKTYITIALMMIIGVMEGLDIYEIPMQVWLFLSLIGLGFIKAGSNRIEQIIEEMRKKDKK